MIPHFCLDVFIEGQFPWIYKKSNEGVLCRTGLEIIWLICGSFSRSFTLPFKLRHFLAFLLLFITCSLHLTVTSVSMDIAVRNDFSSPGLYSYNTVVQKRYYCAIYALNTHRSSHSSQCDYSTIQSSSSFSETVTDVWCICDTYKTLWLFSHQFGWFSGFGWNSWLLPEYRQTGSPWHCYR